MDLRLASAENLSLRKVKGEYETKAIVQNQIGVLVLEGHQLHQLSALLSCLDQLLHATETDALVSEDPVEGLSGAGIERDCPQCCCQSLRHGSHLESYVIIAGQTEETERIQRVGVERGGGGVEGEEGVAGIQRVEEVGRIPLLEDWRIQKVVSEGIVGLR